jgi:hypothetical protein
MANCNPLPPLDVLRRVFALRSDGALIWKRPTSNRVRAGTEAGCAEGSYKLVRLHGALYRAHRIVWALANNANPEDLDVDHINHNGLDNRPCNLRLATRSQDNFNARRSSRSSSGMKGVSWDPSSQKNPWVAYCGKQKLGRFPTAAMAQAAYLQHASQVAGEFFFPG